MNGSSEREAPLSKASGSFYQGRVLARGTQAAENLSGVRGTIGVDQCWIAAGQNLNTGAPGDRQKERVQVPYDEGGADRIGPGSCVSTARSRGEALTGEAMGQVLSRVTALCPGCRRLPCSGRQHDAARHRQCRVGPAWSETLARRRHFLHGNREVSCLAV